jgi:beta-galactosidase
MLAMLVIGSAFSAKGELKEVYPVRDAEWTKSLSGLWKFKYLAGASPGADQEFYRPSFDVSAWKEITVPGHWELQGFAEPRYKRVADGTGLYRSTFRVPETWQGRRVFLRFEGVLYGFEVWVNGEQVGAWTSSYNPSTFDITDALKPGTENLVAVQVATHCKGYDFDQNDCWAISGIYREPFLFSTPQTYFTDYTERTTLNADGSARVQFEAVVSGVADVKSVTVAGRLLSQTDEEIGNWQMPLAGVSGGNAKGEASITVKHPQLWTAETPSLYRVELTLKKGNKTLQQIHERIGLREVTIEDGLLKLNGKPIKLHGVDHHDIWPETGRTASEALLRRDLDLIRGANINFIRTSHYPPDRRLIELCDEMGIYVMCEVPFGFGDEHLTDPAFQENLLVRARATVRRDRNRPSIIVWSVGNENPITPIQLETGREVKRLDPTRPICFPTVGTYFVKNYEKFPEFVDIYAPHYPVISKLREYAETLKRPVIMTEYAHALGLAADRIQDEWEIMYASPRLAGGAIWMFQDQGISRATNNPVDLSAPSKYVWKDATHYYDTYGTDGMDGIVYSDRTPQIDYWQVRKVYSPVRIAEHQEKIRPGAQEITLQLENRYDFRDLSGIKLGWELRTNGAVLESGVQPLKAKAHQKEAVRIKVTLPQELGENIYTLETKCLNESGQVFYERSIRLDPGHRTNPTDLLSSGLRGSSGLKVETDGNITRATHERFELRLARDTGNIEIRGPGGGVVVAGVYPHVGRKFTVAEELRTKTTSIWRGNFLRNPESQTAEVSPTKEGVRVLVRGKYRRTDEPGQFIVGEHTLLISNQGTIEVRYDYTPMGATGTFLEVGMSLVMPASASEFRWIGKGPFAGYPGKDMLNEFGIYHLTRADIRFQGNRREVELALLTNPAGEGLSVAGEGMEVAVENTAEGTVLSHNALVSGRGNKGGGPEEPINADQLKHFSGKFTIMVMGPSWPALLTNWFGRPGALAEVQHPFYHSYDQ